MRLLWYPKQIDLTIDLMAGILSQTLSKSFSSSVSVVLLVINGVISFIKSSHSSHSIVKTLRRGGAGFVVSLLRVTVLLHKPMTTQI